MTDQIDNRQEGQPVPADGNAGASLTDTFLRAAKIGLAVGVAITATSALAMHFMDYSGMEIMRSSVGTFAASVIPTTVTSYCYESGILKRKGPGGR